MVSFISSSLASSFKRVSCVFSVLLEYNRINSCTLLFGLVTSVLISLCLSLFLQVPLNLYGRIFLLTVSRTRRSGIRLYYNITSCVWSVIVGGFEEGDLPILHFTVFQKYDLASQMCQQYKVMNFFYKINTTRTNTGYLHDTCTNV